MPESSMFEHEFELDQVSPRLLQQESVRERTALAFPSIEVRGTAGILSDDLTVVIQRKKQSIPSIGNSLLMLFLSRLLLFWALGGIRYLWNHKNAPLSSNEGWTGFRPSAGRSPSYILESLIWQHACLRYQYWRRLTLSRSRSLNRSL